MSGSMQGNVIAVLYFLLFQVCGLALAQVLLKTEKTSVKVLGGSVLGSVLLLWMPALFAFLFDFGVTAHILAAIVTILVTVVVSLRGKRCAVSEEIKRPELRYAAVPVAVYAVFLVLVLSGLEFRDGAVYSSQATYGDMSMHLGFITSIAQQQTFPPEYSILPGTRLSYPFLSDSISSSLYLWGSSLKLSYCFPMLFAGAQVMYGAWVFLRTWLGQNGKTLLAWVLFFLNGGFGFVYFLTGPDSLQENFTRLFTGFYQTPTNLTDENIRWVNMVVDMLLPQRATLFGYAVLFFALCLLYRAVWQDEEGLFPAVGLFAGALPMIHTHSFLALALVSGCWLLMKLAKECKITVADYCAKMLLIGIIAFMQLTQLILDAIGVRQTNLLLILLILYGCGFLYVLFKLHKRYGERYGWQKLCSTWGAYLVIAACLAVPQLLIWTFGQATGDGFLRGYFNWANIDDNYIWFYIKNLGIAVLMFIPGYLLLGRKFTSVAFPVLIIGLIAELVVFQPNVYDNNKLLYVAYLLVCGVAAEFMWSLYEKFRSRVWVKPAAVLTIFLCTISAVLTMGRELMAEYQLIDPSQYQLAEYVMEHTEPDDIILTDTRHNNAVAVLTGRNIHCGSPSYLYYHGLDYQEQISAAKAMYEEPEYYPDIFKQYNIDYVVIGPSEKYSYAVDEPYFAEHFDCVYDDGIVKVYRVI